MHFPLRYRRNFTVCDLRIHKVALNSKQENNAETPPINFFQALLLRYYDIAEFLLLVLDLRKYTQICVKSLTAKSFGREQNWYFFGR